MPAALAARIKSVKSKESVEPALYAELGRQNKLVQLDKRHSTLAGKLQQWLADKDTYLKGDFSVANSGEARQQLTVFGSFNKEADAMQSGPLPDLKSLGAELASEKVCEGTARSSLCCSISGVCLLYISLVCVVCLSVLYSLLFPPLLYP